MFRRPAKPAAAAPETSLPEPGRLLSELLSTPTVEGILEAALKTALELVGGEGKAYAVLRLGQDRVAAVKGYERDLLDLTLTGPWAAGRARVTSDGSAEVFAVNPPEVCAKLDAAGMREVKTSLVAPLRDRVRLQGALVVDRYGAEGFSPTQLEAVSRWAGSVAPLVTMLEAREEWRQTARQLTGTFVEAVESLDFDALGHARAVAAVSQRLGRAVGLTEREQEELWYAAMLHDLGKLQGEEGHALVGAHLLHDLTSLSEAQRAVRHHHERWDGQGEPEGLAGEDIPLFARILAVANAYAHTGDLGRLAQQAGKALDPRLVAAVEKLERAGQLA